jgi:hypothetical protein
MPDVADLVAVRITHRTHPSPSPISLSTTGKPLWTRKIRIHSHTTDRPAQAGRTNEEPGMDGRESTVTTGIAVRP